jgi:hypothetical protein
MNAIRYQPEGSLNNFQPSENIVNKVCNKGTGTGRNCEEATSKLAAYNNAYQNWKKALEYEDKIKKELGL